MITLVLKTAVHTCASGATEEGVQHGPIREVYMKYIKKAMEEARAELSDKGFPHLSNDSVIVDMCFKK